MLTRLQLTEGWTIFFLPLALVLLSALTIMQADLLNGLGVLLLVSVAGYVSGFFLARSRFSSNTALIFSLGYGLFVIALLVGFYFYPAEMAWRARVLDMLQRQGAWLSQAFSGGTSRDGLIFIMHTSLIYWVLGYTAVWYTFRQRHIWRVILPSGILLLSVVYYYYGNTPLWVNLPLYIILSLLYLSRTYLADQEQDWRYSHIRYRRATSLNFLTASFILALLALIGSSLLPTPAASATLTAAIGGRHPAVQQFQETWTRLFASLRSYSNQLNDPYSNSLALGGPRNVPPTLVMDIRVAEPLPYAYWQVTSYQRYENGAWYAPPGEQLIYTPDEGLFNTPLTAERQIITQTVRNYIPSTSTLVALPEIAGSNKQMFVTQQWDEDGRSLISHVQSRYVLQQGDEYVSYARFSQVDQPSLRQAGTTYPAWVADYLQLPPTISPETRALAAELTAPYDNPYDQVIAVRDYLRQNISYNDQIAAPPAGVDPVHYLLFELQEGYVHRQLNKLKVWLLQVGHKLPAL
jgi:hypothetical protein